MEFLLNVDHPHHFYLPQTQGIRPGLGYSGMTILPGLHVGEIVSAGPFVQNGPLPNNNYAAPVIITYTTPELLSGSGQLKSTPIAEHVYMLGPIPAGFDSAVVGENLYVNDNITLYLESYENTLIPENPRFAAALYAVNRRGATDVLGEKSIINRVGVDLVPVTKTKLMDIDEATMKSVSGRNEFQIDRLTNMAYGPSLEAGRKVVIISSNSEQLGRPRVQQSLAFTFVL